MGIVYLAHDPNLDLPVALKVLRHDRVVSEAFVKRFLAEAKALGKLDHPNIVRVFNVDEDGGTVYIVMEFIEGESLNEIMQKKRFSHEEVINMGIALAEALDYAHQKRIVHRDIKPSNILIRSDGRLKITDFGIAHIEDPSAPEQTQAGEILGTPAYMSPEQVMSKPVDGRSDLFSLGIILYELCTGIRPFGGQTMAAIFNAITQNDPSPIEKANPAIPKGLSQIIMKCLKKIPEERFETGKALAEALKRTLEKEESVSVAKLKKTKNTGFLLFFVIILIILAGVAAYYLVIKKTESAPPPVKIEIPQVVEEARPAFLKVESKPIGAQVFVDGMFKGTTPLKIELLLGKHEVRVTSMDYNEWEAQVQLKDKGETPLFVQLSPVEKVAPAPQQVIEVPLPPQVQQDPAKLEGEINRTLRNAGLMGVTAVVGDDLSVTLKGSIGSVEEKNKALEIARTFKGVTKIKDVLFIVE